MQNVAIDRLFQSYDPSGDWLEADESTEDTASINYQPVADDVNVSTTVSLPLLSNKNYLWCIDSHEGKITLSLPLEVITYPGVDSIVVANDDFNITGIGDSKEEAIKDFEDFFIHDYIVYSETPDDQLDDNSKALLNKYKGVIETFERY